MLNKPKSVINRVEFCANIATHRQSLKTYLETGKWGDVQFFLEEPYLDIPSMVSNKIAMHYMNNDPLVNGANQRAQTVNAT